MEVLGLIISTSVLIGLTWFIFTADYQNLQIGIPICIAWAALVFVVPIFWFSYFFSDNIEISRIDREITKTIEMQQSDPGAAEYFSRKRDSLIKVRIELAKKTLK